MSIFCMLPPLVSLLKEGSLEFTKMQAADVLLHVAGSNEGRIAQIIDTGMLQSLVLMSLRRAWIPENGQLFSLGHSLIKAS